MPRRKQLCPKRLHDDDTNDSEQPASSTSTSTRLTTADTINDCSKSKSQRSQSPTTSTTTVARRSSADIAMDLSTKRRRTNSVSTTEDSSKSGNHKSGTAITSKSAASEKKFIPPDFSCVSSPPTMPLLNSYYGMFPWMLPSLLPMPWMPFPMVPPLPPISSSSVAGASNPITNLPEKINVKDSQQSNSATNSSKKDQNSPSALKLVEGSDGVSSGDALNKLSTLVTKLGKNTNAKPTTGSYQQQLQTSSRNSSPNDSNGLSFHELWWRYMKKEENAEIRRLNEAKQIFTCLQCHESFQTMDELVKHMEATQHFANIPKNYSWSMQYAKQRVRQLKSKMKYSDRMMYYCRLCNQPFEESVQDHFNTSHKSLSAMDCMSFVRVIGVEQKNELRNQSATSLSPKSGTSPPISPLSTQSMDPMCHSSQSPLHELKKLAEYASSQTPSAHE